MSFPDFDTWKKVVVNPDEFNHIAIKKKYDYYLEKYSFAGRCKVENPVIGEIGVRYGYSAASFLFAHPTASYHGWDVINGGHGGVREGTDTFTYVRKMLQRNFPDAYVQLTHKSSQLLTDFGDVKFDLFHVDGNHRFDCCTHDMEIVMEALKPGGIMIVDDYTYIASVKKAVDQFIIDQGIEKFEIIEKGFRGNAIVLKND